MEIKVLTLTINAFKLYVLCISIWKVFRLEKEYEWSLTYLVSHLCEKLKVFEVYSLKYRVEWTFSPSNTSKLKKKGYFEKIGLLLDKTKYAKWNYFITTVAGENSLESIETKHVNISNFMNVLTQIFR